MLTSINKKELNHSAKQVCVKKTADRLDRILLSDEKIGMIKISVVGSDFNVLKGCETIIREQKPAIVIEWEHARRVMCSILHLL